MESKEKQVNVGSVGPVQEIQKAQILTIEGPDGRKAPVLLVPSGDGSMDVHDGLPFIEDYQPKAAPHRTKGTATIESLGSFIEHVRRFKRAETALFIRRSPAALEAVYDYHANSSPAFAEHRAQFAFAPTLTWKAWKEKSGKEMAQAEFAEFLEDRSGDMIDPTSLPPSAKEAVSDAERATGATCVHPEAIRVLARGLEYHHRATRSDLINLRNGTRQVKFEEKLEGKDGETLDIPGLFAVAIEMFDARLPGDPDPDKPGELLPAKSSRYVVPVRLRVKALPGESGGLRWTLLLHNVDRCIDLALNESAERVAKDTGCPVFWGSPER